MSEFTVWFEKRNRATQKQEQNEAKTQTNSIRYRYLVPRSKSLNQIGKLKSIYIYYIQIYNIYIYKTTTNTVKGEKGVETVIFRLLGGKKVFSFFSYIKKQKVGFTLSESPVLTGEKGCF